MVEPSRHAKVTRRRTQEERRIAAESRMLDAGIELVAERGCRNMTLGDVGEKAGFSRGLPSHHFKTKAGLFAAIEAETMKRMIALFETENDLPHGLATLEAIIRNVLAHTTTPLALAFLEFQKEAIPIESANRECVQSFTQEAVALLEAEILAGQAAGEIRADTSPATQATLLLASLLGLLAHLQPREEAVAPTAAAEALVRRTSRVLRK